MDDSTAILLDAALGYTATAIVVISLWAVEAPSVWTFAAALLGFGMVAPLTWVRLSADGRAWAVAGMGGFALAYLLGIIPLVLYAGASGLWFQVGCCVGYSAIGFLPLGYLAFADRAGQK